MVSRETWNPATYLSFADQRLRPALDLLARIPHVAPEAIVDLGCGAGNVTRLLRERWPQAPITGIDNSPEMLARATGELPDANWVQADLADWLPSQPVDLLFSNAALHWLPDHAALFPRLLAMLNPGGVLAVQMPANFVAPSHQLVYALANQPRWRERMVNARQGAVLTPGAYYALLAPMVRCLDLWETEYQQELQGDDPVLNWLLGTTLRPLLGKLEASEQAAFLDELRPQLAQAYPKEANGCTLFPFRRLFLVACR